MEEEEATVQWRWSHPRNHLHLRRSREGERRGSGFEASLPVVPGWNWSVPPWGSRAMSEFRKLGLGLVAHYYRIWDLGFGKCEVMVGQYVGDWMVSGREVNIEGN